MQSTISGHLDDAKPNPDGSAGRVLIVGAGVIGSTTAIILRSKNFSVDVYHDEENFDTEQALKNLTGHVRTASPAAAAFWMPFLVDESADSNRITEWAQYTYCVYSGEKTHEGLPIVGGVTKGKCYIIGDSLTDLKSAKFLRDPQMLSFLKTNGNLRNHQFDRDISLQFDTHIIDARASILALRAHAKKCGVRFARRTLKQGDLEHLAQNEYKDGWVINCTGLHGAELSMDVSKSVPPDDPSLEGHQSDRSGISNMIATRGDLLLGDRKTLTVPLLPDPQGSNSIVLINEQSSTELVYLVCNPTEVLIGGTAIDIALPLPPKESQQDEAIVNNTLAQHHKLRPLPDPWGTWVSSVLKTPNTLRHIYGYRPNRRGGPRVERDLVNPRIVHNYGHSGAGWTLCWGCANQVLQLISEPSDQQS